MNFKKWLFDIACEENGGNGGGSGNGGSGNGSSGNGSSGNGGSGNRGSGNGNGNSTGDGNGNGGSSNGNGSDGGDSENVPSDSATTTKDVAPYPRRLWGYYPYKPNKKRKCAKKRSDGRCKKYKKI